MPKPNGQPSRWVEKEAAKHTTYDSMRRRIAEAEKHLRALASLGLSREMEQAREAHGELIQVLSERLARAGKQSP